MEKTLKDYYNNVAEYYDEMTKDVNYSVGKWLSKINIPQNIDNVLDLGCGNGYVIRHLSENHNYKRVVGIDYSMKMVKEARNTKLYEKVLYHDLRKKLPKTIQNDSFDIVFAFGFLEYITNINRLFKDVKSCLKGKFIFTLQRGIKNDKIYDTKITMYTKEEVLDLLKKHGMEIISINEDVGFYYGDDTINYFYIVAKV